MAEHSWFFNAVETAPGKYDREYQAADFARYFGKVLTTGLLHDDRIPGLAPKCEGADLRTYVEPGSAIIKGYMYENTTDLYLQHDLPEQTMDRIDRIVLRMDNRNENRFIKLFVKTGEPSENPVPPTLQRDSFIYELSLAQIRVRANTSSLNPADLLDERLDETVCGLVRSLIDLSKEKAQVVNYNQYASGKDENWIFTVVEYRRLEDNSLRLRSTLSEPNLNGQYELATWDYYDEDGVEVVQTVRWRFTYDTDGDIIKKEVVL